VRRARRETRRARPERDIARAAFVTASTTRGRRCADGALTMACHAVFPRAAAVLSLMLVLAGCRGAESEQKKRASASAEAVRVAPRSAAADSAAILDSFARIVRAIDNDSLRFERRQQPVTLGAGTSGVLTSWRLGRIWQRLHVDGAGEAFHTRDTYWFSNGALLGAQLELSRTGRKPLLDHVWFRNNAVFRWTDAEGRWLLPAARSTQYEVQMLRARLDTLLQTLARTELQQQQQQQQQQQPQLQLQLQLPGRKRADAKPHNRDTAEQQFF
jgi:hypothetical protein